MSPAQKSLADYAVARAEAEAAPPPGHDLQPTRFAESLLTGKGA
jgi:hypothetical protein